MIILIPIKGAVDLHLNGLNSIIHVSMMADDIAPRKGIIKSHSKALGPQGFTQGFDGFILASACVIIP